MFKLSDTLAVFSRRWMSPESAMFTEFVKRLKIDGCFHEYDYISLLKFEESRCAKFKIQVEEATIANFAVLE